MTGCKWGTVIKGACEDYTWGRRNGVGRLKTYSLCDYDEAETFWAVVRWKEIRREALTNLNETTKLLESQNTRMNIFSDCMNTMYRSLPTLMVSWLGTRLSQLRTNVQE